jgi:hypothetical protein
MIIKLIPETEAEKLRSSEVEIKNVREFFVMGNNVTEEGNYNEFHEWTGSYRYLYGTLNYYAEVLNDERREAQTRRKMNSDIGPQLRVIEAEADDVNDDVDDDKGEEAED